MNPSRGFNRPMLEALAELQPPASEEDVRRAEEALEGKLPADLADLLQQSDGMFARDLIRIYATKEIAERNKTNEVRQCAPGWLMIGDDSGDYGVFLNVSVTESPVYLIGVGWLSPDESIEQAASLHEWFQIGMPLRYSKSTTDVSRP